MGEGFKNEIEKLVASTKSGIKASSFEKALSKSSDLASLHDSVADIAKTVGARKDLIIGDRYDGAARKKDFLAITKDSNLAPRAKQNIRELLDGLGHRRKFLLADNKKVTPKPNAPAKAKNRRMPYHFGASSGLNSGVNNTIGAGGGIQPSARPNAPRLVV